MHDALNNRIAEFETALNRLATDETLPAPEVWEGLWNEQNAIINDFRSVKYPERDEKDAAWNIFSGVRELFKVLHNDFSSKNLNLLSQAIKATAYQHKKEQIFENPTFETLKTASDDIKSRQKAFAAQIEVFKAVKYIMTKDDKGTLIVVMDEVRNSHQAFWDEQPVVYAALREAKDKEYSEKHELYLQKQAQFKERLIGNIKNNEMRLQKALNYKINLQDQIVKHNEKLAEDIGEIFRSRVLAWKAETEQKMQDVAAQILRYEQFIDEDTHKLNTVTN